MIIELDSKVIW